MLHNFVCDGYTVMKNAVSKFLVFFWRFIDELFHLDDLHPLRFFFSVENSSIKLYLKLIA